jgi:hypothetical protein
MTDQILFDAILSAGMATKAEGLGVKKANLGTANMCSIPHALFVKDFGDAKTNCGSSTEICRA